MDFLLALNVTIYGLGIVFLALLILMFSIMVLSKLFSLATGKEVFSVASTKEQAVATIQTPGASATVAVAVTPDVTAPAAAAEHGAASVAEILEQVVAPLPGKVLSVAVQVGGKVKPGDELCVIEAMKMGNSIKAQQEGVVGEVLVSPGQSVSFGSPLVVIVREGAARQVPRAAAATAAATADAATPTVATAAALAGFKMGVSGTQHQVEFKTGLNGSRVVAIDGASYKVEQDKTDSTKMIVDGVPHTVEVKDRGAGSAFVIVDGIAQKIEISKVPASGETVSAPLPGKILTVAVKAGDVVKAGDELCVIEAMKMGNSIKAQRLGTIVDVLVSPGQSVGFGAPLVEIG